MRLVTQEGYSLAEAARSLGVHVSRIRKWKEKFMPQDKESPLLTEDEKAELKRLRKENRRLKMERVFYLWKCQFRIRIFFCISAFERSLSRLMLKPHPGYSLWNSMIYLELITGVFSSLIFWCEEPVVQTESPGHTRLHPGYAGFSVLRQVTARIHGLVAMLPVRRPDSVRGLAAWVDSGRFLHRGDAPCVPLCAVDLLRQREDG
ncbi:MAG: transposase [Planctomycetaceae bacterium]|nr:transposase [Planctomycetaceae bacterium]